MCARAAGAPLASTTPQSLHGGRQVGAACAAAARPQLSRRRPLLRPRRRTPRACSSCAARRRRLADGHIAARTSCRRWLGERARAARHRASRWSIACSGRGVARGLGRLDELLVVGDVAATHGAGASMPVARGGGVRRRARRRRAGRWRGCRRALVVAVPLNAPRPVASAGRCARRGGGYREERRCPFIPKLFRRGKAISPSDWNDSTPTSRPRPHGVRRPPSRRSSAPGDVGMVCRRMPGCASSAVPVPTTSATSAGGANGSNGSSPGSTTRRTRSPTSAG